MLMKIIKLTEQFYKDYGHCKEILMKQNRPYYCVCVSIDGHRFAIPFRHHIQHSYCFHTIGEAGIDYSKAVLLWKKEYISAETVTIDSKEYRAIKGREALIENGMRNYLKLYIKALKYKDNPNYQKIIQYSSLKYFVKSEND